jgi:AcrR family transcriptional regulator
MTNSPPKRKAGAADNRVGARNKAAIIDAAIAVFGAKGFDGTRIAEVAAKAGLPKANVYYYFKSKKALYTAIISSLLGGWDDALEELRADREPADAIAAYIRAKLDFSRRYKALSKMFANEAIHGGRFLTRQNRAHMHAITAEKAKIFEGWAKAGKMDPVDPIHLFVMLWSTTQFYSDFEVWVANALGTRRVTNRDFETAAAQITRIVLKGCGVKGTAP